VRALVILASLVVGFGLLLVAALFFGAQGLCESGQDDCPGTANTVRGVILVIAGLAVLFGGLSYAGRRR
jgi:hypothetical protein